MPFYRFVFVHRSRYRVPNVGGQRQRRLLLRTLRGRAVRAQRFAVPARRRVRGPRQAGPEAGVRGNGAAARRAVRVHGLQPDRLVGRTAARGAGAWLGRARARGRVRDGPDRGADGGSHVNADGADDGADENS